MLGIPAPALPDFAELDRQILAAQDAADAIDALATLKERVELLEGAP